MNLLIICHYGLYKDMGASFVHNQAKMYARLGHQVRVLIPIAVGKTRKGKRMEPPIVWEEQDHVQLCYVRFLSFSNFGQKNNFNTKLALRIIKKKCKEILDGFYPDVIHAHTLGLDSEIGSWLKNQVNCPLVVTTHGSDTTILYEQGNRQQLKEYCDKADAVIGVSSSLISKLKDCGTCVRLESILNGFELSNVCVPQKKQPLSFVQVGNLIPQKKTDVTIRAFAKLYKEFPMAKLTVIGDGPERKALETLCQNLGVGEAVHFLGRIPNSEVFAVMNKTEYFVMPSVREGFGIVYLEAMVSGCITIGTEKEGIADLIRSGENGFLVPADCTNSIVSVVKWCLENPDEALQVASKGRTCAKELTWEKNASQYIAFFESIIQG